MRSVKVLLASAIMLFMPLVCQEAPAQEYILGEGDLLKITVYENEDLTTETRVSGDGVIRFPLVGEITVSGLSVREAESRLTGLLAEGFIIDPHVTLFVKEYRSKKVTVLGEVRKPGICELNGNVTLLEIISQAEGMTEKAGDTILIKHKERPGSSEQSCTVVNLKDLMEKGDLTANSCVQDGDSIFVTKGGFVYVTGEVKKPGAFKYEGGMTVIKAIALAEGLTDKAAPGRTKVIRKYDGKEKTLKAEMGFPVQPDDVINVPESFF